MPSMTLVATRDTYIIRDSPNPSDFTKNFGSETTLRVGWAETAGSFYGFIGFDLSELPPGVQITSAKLRLYRLSENNYESGNVVFGFSMNASNWQEMTLTASNANLSSLRGVISVTLQPGTGRWDEFQANAAYVEVLNEMFLGIIENTGFLLNDQEGASSIKTYATREHSNTAYHPQLVVEFEYQNAETPTNLSPSTGTTINRTIVNRFSWTFNPSFQGDSQTKFDLQWSANGGVSWTTVSQNTANTYYDMPANTLPNGGITWRVRVTNSVDKVSLYAGQQVITAANPPSAPTINTNSINTALPVINWTASGQVAFEIKILDGAVEVENSGVVPSTNPSYRVQNALETGKTYTFQLRIQNAAGLWSAVASKNIPTAFDTPSAANILLLTNNKRGYTVVDIKNNTGGAQFLENEIWRRKPGGTWQRIAKGIPWDGEYIDYTQESGQQYEYKARTVAVTLGYADSQVQNSKISIPYYQLALTADFDKWAQMRYNVNKTNAIGYNRQLMQFAGRKRSVVEFGEHENFSIELEYEVKNYDEVKKIIEILDSREIILYRDSRGDKMYCTSAGVEYEESTSIGTYTIRLTLDEVDYSEVV